VKKTRQNKRLELPFRFNRNGKGSKEINMPEYRAYLIGQDGHFIREVALDYPDDISAAAAAQRLVDANVVELWCLDCKIAQFDSWPEQVR
jgi:hypothetical protein